MILSFKYCNKSNPENFIKATLESNVVLKGYVVIENYMVMATSAFDASCGVTHTNYDDIITKKEMMNCSKKIILCEDSSKYGLVKRWNLCSIDEADIIITDSRLSKEGRSDFDDKGINLIYADKKS